MSKAGFIYFKNRASSLALVSMMSDRRGILSEPHETAREFLPWQAYGSAHAVVLYVIFRRLIKHLRYCGVYPRRPLVLIGTNPA
jgi:hypothetical protein